MQDGLAFHTVGSFGSSRQPIDAPGSAGQQTWRALPLFAQLYVAAVIASGLFGLVLFFPRTFPQPVLFGILVLFSCLTSTWKVTLPIPVANGSTLSVSYAANLMSLLLLDVQQAVIIAAIGVLTQCSWRAKKPYPVHRTIFSVAMAIITMAATGVVYASLGGPAHPLNAAGLARPLVGAIGTYFLLNTSLVAGAIALSTHRTFLGTWTQDFLWSGASFMFAGSAGALTAVIVDRGEQWKAALMLAPIYLTYRTYEMFIGRLDDQRRYVAEMRALHQETVAALGQARDAERALAAEKDRLASALAEKERVEQLRRELLEREQKARETAEQANRLKDQFLATVSHELRTPLNAILGWSDMLRRGKLEPGLRDRAFRAIHDSAKRQSELVEDLLDVARIMSGKLRLDRTIVDLEDLVQGVLDVIKPAADTRRIRLVVGADVDLPPIYGDRARLQQVASNLLSNAVKFTPEGGAVHIRLRRAGRMVELSVIDTGQGIRPEFLPELFEPFRQADASTTRAHRGLGLGLSIVRSLVEAHHGSVRAWSQGEGRGSTFSVLLPIGADDVPSEWTSGAATSGEPDDLVSLEGVSVLVVDDDAESRDVVAAHLQRVRASVLTASSASEAFRMLQRERVDVLVADIGMPQEDGYTFLKRLQRSPATAAIPAAALTAFARDEDRRQALEAGFQMHLAKPIDPRTLVHAVAELGRRRHERNRWSVGPS